jgi:tetratricopeptide (TPR) repeat protein
MRTTFAFLSVLLLPSTMAAQEVDKQKLRQTLRLPTIHLQQGLEIDIKTGLHLSGQLADGKKEIAKIHKELKSDASDAERYVLLGELLFDQGEAEQSKMAYKHAAALLRQRLKADPDNAKLLAQLGRALAGGGHHKDAEASLRQAVKLGDKDWQCWTMLGQYLQDRALHALFVGMDTGVNKMLDCAALCQYAAAGKIERKHAHKANVLLKESLACFDKAVELAPKESEVFYRRAVCHFGIALLRPALHVAHGEKVPLSAVALPISAKAAADFDRAAQLQPDDPLLLGTAALYQWMVSTARGNQTTDKERLRMGGYVQQLKELAGNSNPDIAARASNLLGFMHFAALNDLENAEKYYRQTVKIEPANDAAWDMLTVLVIASGRVDECIRVCEQRLKCKQSGHNCFLLAKAHAENNELVQAEMALRQGVKVEPGNFHCQLGLATILLMQEGGAKTRKEAFNRLHEAGKLLGNPPRAEWASELQIAEAAYHALYGETHVARKKLTRLSLLEPENDRVRELLKVVGE